MSSVPAPHVPQYRISLFYGPDTLEGDPLRHCCIFNVKKRSWRSGVQVAVEVTEGQLSEAKEAAEFELWLREVLASIPSDEQCDYETRARDLFIQGICGLKLDLAIEAGLPHENGSVAADRLVGELESAAPAQADRLKSQILSQLDLSV